MGRQGGPEDRENYRRGIKYTKPSADIRDNMRLIPRPYIFRGAKNLNHAIETGSLELTISTLIRVWISNGVRIS